jgi:hypothetical protein
LLDQQDDAQGAHRGDAMRLSADATSLMIENRSVLEEARSKIFKKIQSADPRKNNQWRSIDDPAFSHGRCEGKTRNRI